MSAIRYFCSTLGEKPGGEPSTLMVLAPTSKIARAYAAKRLGNRGLIVHPAGGMAGVDVELRVVGECVEVREKTPDGFSEWRRA